MRKVTGKQMKTVWRKEEFTAKRQVQQPKNEQRMNLKPGISASRRLDLIWTIAAPAVARKSHGKHPTQKPVALVERCLLASTNEGDLVLDPFLGNGTTAVASLRLKRGCVGVELDLHHVEIAVKRVKSALEQNA